MINLSKLRKRCLLMTLMLLGTALFLSIPTLMKAQAISGDLLGTVTDSSGAVIPNASVVATNLGTGAKVTTKTNATGEYHFVNLPVGHYSLEMTGNGMTGGYKDVQVQLNHQVTANIIGAVSSASTTIEVTAEAASIDTSTAQIQNTFATKELEELPTATVGLGVLNLSLLNAGGRPAAASGREPAPPSPVSVRATTTSLLKAWTTTANRSRDR